MNPILKYLGMITLAGATVIVPATSVALTNSNYFISNDSVNNGGNNSDSSNPDDNTDQGGDNGGGDDTQKPPVNPETPLKINDNVSITSNFEDILKGFESQKTMNDAMTDILNKPENLPKVISNYDQFSNKNITLKVDGIQQNSSEWGSNPYSSWQTSATTKAVVNEYSQIFTISTLNDLKDQLNSEKIQELLNASGLETSSYSSFAIESNSALGVENFNDGVKDLVHIFVVATNGNELVRTTTNIDLGIPISNIKYTIQNANISGVVSDKTKEISSSNINVSFGIDTKIENTYSKDIVFQPDNNQATKESISIEELLKRFSWSKQITGYSGENVISNLDSNKIGKDLGIYNVDFLSVQDTTPIKIGQEGYNGMQLTFTIKPKTGFVWEDGSSNEKQLEVSNIQAKIQDGYMMTYARTYNPASRYVFEWEKIFKEDINIKDNFIDDLDQLKAKFNNNDFFEKFSNGIMSSTEYGGDFKSITFKIKQDDISYLEGMQNNHKIYSLAIYPVPLPGHIMKPYQDSIQTDAAGYFKLVYKK